MKKLLQSIALIVLLLVTGCQSDSGVSTDNIPTNSIPTENTPTTDTLIESIEKNDLAEVQMITRKINVNEKSSSGVIPIFFAMQKGSVEIISSLIEAGARCDITDENKNTPLHIAIQDEKDDIVELLLDNSKLDAKNSQKKTPIDIAKRKKNYRLLTRIYYDKNDVDKTAKYGKLAVKKDGGDIASKYYLCDSLFKQAKAFNHADKWEKAISTAERVKTLCGKILAVDPKYKDIKKIKSKNSKILKKANQKLKIKREAEKKAASAKAASSRSSNSGSSSSSDDSENSSSEYVCSWCNGTKQVTCSECRGTGRAYRHEDENCVWCKGTGHRECNRC